MDLDMIMTPGQFIINSTTPLLIYDFFDMDLAVTMAMESPNGAWMKQFSNSSTASAAQRTLLVSQMATLASHDASAAVCSVCMDGFEAEQGSGKVTRCGHVYHGDCIIQWLSQKDSCPICRCKISAAD